jgi:hypothetical protein
MTRSNCALLARALSAVLAAGVCGCGSSGGQTGSESYGCLPVSAEPLGPEETSALGVSAADVLARFAAYEQGRLRYSASGELVGYTLVLQQSGPARFEEREWRSDGSGIELATDCEDALVVPVTLAFDTDDGAFAERWTSFVTASASGFTSLNARARTDALAGSYEPNPSEVASAIGVNVLFDLALLDPTFLGTLSLQIEEGSSSSSDPNGSIGAREIQIATFPASAQ